MASTEWYRHWFNSPYYHKLYFDRDEKEASHFIQRLLQHLNPPAESRLLDVACGKGRHSKILAASGFDVTGIDISEYSISEAKKEASDKLQFYVHDMRLPFWVNYFDYAFNFFTSFGYFRTRREHDDAVRTIVNSLTPGGTLMFDYLNVHYAEDHLVHNEVKTIDATRYELHRWHDDHHFYKRILITDPALEDPLEFTEKVSKITFGDFTDMLSFQNMQVTEVFGDYNLAPYDVRKSPRLIILAKKRNIEK